MANNAEKAAKNTSFLKGVRSEWKKLIWPTRKELFSYTAIVAVISIVLAIIVYGLDTIIHYLLGLIIG